MFINFNIEKCLKAKEELHKYDIVGKIWRENFSPSNSIGNCTYLYRLLNPENYIDFYKKYIEYADKNSLLNIWKRGLTEEEIIKLAINYKELVEKNSNINKPFETYLYDAICHIIVETYDGQFQEKEFIEYLKEKGFNCTKFDSNIDTKYGVDIKVTTDVNKVFAIQIKPISFFLSNRQDVINDRINLCIKYEKALKELNIKTYYAIYDKNKKTNEIKWFKNKDNGFKFRITDLLTYDIIGLCIRLILLKIL